MKYRVETFRGFENVESIEEAVDAAMRMIAEIKDDGLGYKRQLAQIRDNNGDIRASLGWTWEL